MKVFLSSTFLDLAEERDAVRDALRKKRVSTLAMEDFLAEPDTPLNVALENLRKSDLMVLILGFKAGSLLPDGSGATYTSAEYDELLKLGKEPLVFVKQKKRWWHRVPSWRNEEKDSSKRKALDAFKGRLGAWTWDSFTTPDGLALAVIQAIDAWEARGRPGARKTFASPADYFAGKNPPGHFQILDFGTTLLGRDQQIRALDAFAADAMQRVCVLSGRGGIGKSKILHDWAASRPAEVVFLKDEALWHEDSDKEIAITCKTVIVDDAHRHEDFGKILQLIQETTTQRNLKLLISTRPGSAPRLVQKSLQRVDSNQLTQLPELQELNQQESRALAEEVLGDQFRNYSVHLAQIGSNSPLVIVAGGRLIASRRVDPAALTTLEQFRATVFNRLLEDMDLRGQRFAIDPPTEVLNLISALGPVDVERRDFQRSASTLLDRPVDQILATIDALAATGVITPRPKPVRVIPDVLSDYVLEARCVGLGGTSTLYADRVYEHFGAHSLKSLMRNLAELDWRRGGSVDGRLNLLDRIWADIHRRFRAGDEYERRSILTDLSGAAIYQPSQVLSLVRTALEDPVVVNTAGEGSRYRAGQTLVLSTVPGLLEATAHHADHLPESITILWELAKNESDRGNIDVSAKSVLKRLSSWHRFGNPALNFAMLVQAIRLNRRADAFAGDYTPFVVIQQILQRDGEYNEWLDDETMTFGGFGLNYRAVGPVRESTLDYLDFVLAGDGIPAIHAVSIMEDLLHNYLNRMGRETTDEERQWQNRERERCFRALLQRFGQNSSSLLRAKLYDAFRSATAISCPEPIRQAATAALAEIELDDAAAVVDAICTADHDLPVLTTEFDPEVWERPIMELMSRGRRSLERLAAGFENQARFTIDQTRACIEARVKTGGFRRFMLAFTDRPEFLSEMADQLAAQPRISEVVRHLSDVLHSIHVADPEQYRRRALSALESGNIQVIHAAASNLRVFEAATEEDVAVIRAYAGYPDPGAKRSATFAIAYMGKFVELRQSLKDAALSIRVEGDESVADGLTDAFGSYGIPLTDLTRQEAAALASEFVAVDDWEFAQGTIPRFLNRFVSLFPDETYAILLDRIALRFRAGEGDRAKFRTFGLVRESISFGGVPTDKRLELGRDCIARLTQSDSGEDLADLFWDVVGYDESALRLVLEVAHDLDERAVGNIIMLIDRAIPRLAFTNTGFARDLIGCFAGSQRAQIVEAFARQARQIPRGVFGGDPDVYWAEQSRQLSAQIAAIPDDPGLEDLTRALRNTHDRKRLDQ